MNRIILTGRLTHDPQLQVSANGTEHCLFSIAVNREFHRDGQPTADFFDCVAFRNNAKYIATYAERGTLIECSGQVQLEPYTDKYGNRKLSVRVVLDAVSILQKPKAKSVAEEEQDEEDPNPFERMRDEPETAMENQPKESTEKPVQEEKTETPDEKNEEGSVEKTPDEPSAESTEESAEPETPNAEDAAGSAAETQGEPSEETSEEPTEKSVQTEKTETPDVESAEGSNEEPQDEGSEESVMQSKETGTGTYSEEEVQAYARDLYYRGKMDSLLPEDPESSEQTPYA